VFFLTLIQHKSGKLHNYIKVHSNCRGDILHINLTSTIKIISQMKKNHRENEKLLAPISRAKSLFQLHKIVIAPG